MLLEILVVKKFLECFTKKNRKKTNQKEFRIEKIIKGKDNKLYAKWKGHDNSYNSWADKTISFGRKCKIKLNYGTKSGSKHATGDDTLKFVKKVVLAGLKSEIDKVDIGKLETTPSDFKGNVKSLLAFVLFISF